MDRQELLFQAAESEFVKDEFYEDFQAPKFYDFCLPHQSVDADSWFRVTSSQSGVLNNVPPETPEAEAEVPERKAPTGKEEVVMEVATSAPRDSQEQENLSSLFDKLLLLPNSNSSQPPGDDREELPAGVKTLVEVPSISEAPLKVTDNPRDELKCVAQDAGKADDSMSLHQPCKQQNSRKRKSSKVMAAGNLAGAPSGHDLVRDARSNQASKVKGALKKLSGAGKSGSRINEVTSVRQHHGCFVGQHKKLKTTCPQPFRLLTEERGAIKEREFSKKIEQYNSKDNLQLPSSFSSTTNTAWGGVRTWKPVLKDMVKDLKRPLEQSLQFHERIAGQPQGKAQLDKLGEEKQVKEKEREPFKEIQGNTKVNITSAVCRKVGKEPGKRGPQDCEKIEEERGALKEIKHNWTTDSCAPNQQGHSLSSAYSILAGKVRQLVGRVDKTNGCQTLKMSDCPLQTWRSTKKLTIPKAPSFHLSRSKRECAKNELRLKRD